MSAKRTLLEMIKNEPNLERYHMLEKHFDNNKVVKNEILYLKNLQKQMINAEHISKDNLHKSLKDEYEKRLDSLYQTPFLEEYLELQTYFNEIIKQVSETIEESLNKDFLLKNTD